LVVVTLVMVVGLDARVVSPQPEAPQSKFLSRREQDDRQVANAAVAGKPLAKTTPGFRIDREIPSVA